MGGTHLSIDDDLLKKLDEWTLEYRNNNRTALVEDLIELSEEATAATRKDDPCEAIEALLNEYPGYDRSNGYHSDADNVTLTREDIQKLVESDPVPPINPDHVQRGDIRNMLTWDKAGLVASLLRFKSDDAKWDVVKRGGRKLKLKYCGGRSRLDIETIAMRYKNSVPAANQLDTKLSVDDWMGLFREWKQMDREITADVDRIEEFESMGVRIVSALEEDNDPRLGEAKELREFASQLVAEKHREQAEQAQSDPRH